MSDVTKIDILGVRFEHVDFDGAIERLVGFIGGDAPRAVYTPNPEIVMVARRDAGFMEVLRRGDMILPESVGIVLAARIFGHRLRGRVTGIDTATAVFKRVKDMGISVYFYGGAPGVAETAKARVEEAYPGLSVAGVSHGFLDEDGQRAMIEEIKRLSPQILLVGTGSPRQERFIDRHKAELPCKLLMGVGGAFDVMSGRLRRAPAIFRKLNLEWLYRLVREPSRLKRQLQLPLFMLVVLKERIVKGNR